MKTWKKHNIIRCHHCLGVIETYTEIQLDPGVREAGDIARCTQCDKTGMISVDDSDNEYIYWGTKENGF